jgi:alpha-amylase
MGKIYFAIGIHNHQPVGNFDGVFEDAYKRAYLPFLEMMEHYPGIKFALHNSGSLHEWIQEHHPEYIDKLRAMVKRGQVEIIGGGFYEPILTILPEPDRTGQVSSYSDFLEGVYGRRPQGAWLAERVWEQFLASSLAKAGVRYTMLDDTHFKNAGLVDEQLLGYYTTENEGFPLNVFPISEKLRYFIPFRRVEEVIEYLSSLAQDGREHLIVYADDGEKFGTWPGTHKHVYTDGWLKRFLDALTENPWIEIIHFSEALEKLSSLGRVYLPDASYREMGEWVLQIPARERYEQLTQLLKDRGVFEMVSFCIRGGTWRNYRVKYPEAARMYAKMLEVSHLVNASRSSRRAEALRELYRGECNCAYWHGIFGGLYLPHLRTAVYEKLISAENLISRAGAARAVEKDCLSTTTGRWAAAKTTRRLTPRFLQSTSSPPMHPACRTT